MGQQHVETTRQLKGFAFTVGGVFAVIALLPLVFGGAIRLWAAAPAIVLPALGALAPRTLVWPYRAWMKLGEMLGWINTRILLAAIYYAVVTPIGLVMRVIGRDPLDRALTDRPSYWVERTPTTHPKTSMERSF